MDDAITLIGMAYTTDKYGNQVPTSAERRVLCTVQSVRGSEWYDASQQGIRLDYVFVLSEFIDYRGEEVVKYKDWTGTERDYRVIRTYRRSDGAIELTCAERTVTPGVEDDES